MYRGDEVVEMGTVHLDRQRCKTDCFLLHVYSWFGSGLSESFAPGYWFSEHPKSFSSIWVTLACKSTLADWVGSVASPFCSFPTIPASSCCNIFIFSSFSGVCSLENKNVKNVKVIINFREKFDPGPTRTKITFSFFVWYWKCQWFFFSIFCYKIVENLICFTFLISKDATRNDNAVNRKMYPLL